MEELLGTRNVAVTWSQKSNLGGWPHVAVHGPSCGLHLMLQAYFHIGPNSPTVAAMDR